MVLAGAATISTIVEGQKITTTLSRSAKQQINLHEVRGKQRRCLRLIVFRHQEEMRRNNSIFVELWENDIVIVALFIGQFTNYQGWDIWWGEWVRLASVCTESCVRRFKMRGRKLGFLLQGGTQTDLILSERA